VSVALIYTIHGDMDESLLEKTEGVVDNDNEHTTWVEYRLNGEVVRRDVHVALKKGLEMVPAQESF
jgi:hypothetical protein